jgi:hypothetical protein
MEGHLFFLDKALLYISRNPLYVPYSDIQEVRFERVSGALTTSRTFDLIVQMKGVRNEHTFSAVSKEEQSSVEDYLKREKKLKVKNVMEENVQAVNSAIAEALMDEDSSDDDAPRARGGDDDEDSEVDEDFKADSDDDDVAEEFDEVRGHFLLLPPPPFRYLYLYLVIYRTTPEAAQAIQMLLQTQEAAMTTMMTTKKWKMKMKHQQRRARAVAAVPRINQKLVIQKHQLKRSRKRARIKLPRSRQTYIHDVCYESAGN